MNEDEKRNCFNCSYFIQYYIKDKYGNLLKIEKGHCANFTIRKRSNRTFELCGQWKEREPSVVKRNRTIKYILKNIEHYIENLSNAIKDDDELETYVDETIS